MSVLGLDLRFARVCLHVCMCVCVSACVSSCYVNSSITVPLSLSPSGHPHNKTKLPPGKEKEAEKWKNKTKAQKDLIRLHYNNHSVK